jgi:hypothetical protein
MTLSISLVIFSLVILCAYFVCLLFFWNHVSYYIYYIIYTSLYQEVVFISDPGFPFVIAHHEVRVPALSFIRLPVRMVPITSGTFTRAVNAVSSSGRYRLHLTLRGNA